MKLFLHELRAQQRLFWRSPELAFFTFALPLILYVMLASVNRDDRVEGVRGPDYLLAGMIGYGAAATAFAGLAILLVIRRESGLLKRLRATPLPASTYVAAVLVSILIVFLLETAALVALATTVFDAEVPDRLGSLLVLLLLGAATFAALGIALASVIRSGEGASAVVNAIYLPASFLSGSFFSPEAFPEALQWLADALPLTYFIRLVRDVILHGEPIWESPGSLAFLAVSGIVGAVVAARAFSWEPRER